MTSQICSLPLIIKHYFSLGGETNTYIPSHRPCGDYQARKTIYQKRLSSDTAYNLRSADPTRISHDYTRPELYQPRSAASRRRRLKAWPRHQFRPQKPSPRQRHIKTKLNRRRQSPSSWWRKIKTKLGDSSRTHWPFSNTLLRS